MKHLKNVEQQPKEERTNKLGKYITIAELNKAPLKMGNNEVLGKIVFASNFINHTASTLKIMSLKYFDKN